MPPTQQATLPKPPWLKVRPAQGPLVQRIRQQVAHQGLATVCQEANCPNLAECWGQGVATFMAMGAHCTRACRFCHVGTTKTPAPLDPQEPHKLAASIAEAGWRYVVLTSVDRDDLPDGGAQHLAACVQRINEACPQVQAIEVLSPDFAGDAHALATLLESPLRVLAHNLETVERLTPSVRDRRATYAQSLALLQQAKVLRPTLITKSSLMLGLGETEDELRQAFSDLRAVGVDVLTLGQYLQPSPKHLPVQAYVEPALFAQYKHIAEAEFGFMLCASGPLVRSSFKAADILPLIERLPERT